MKAICMPQPYAAMACVSGEFVFRATDDTDYRGKVLVCAGDENLVPAFEGIMLNHAMCVCTLNDSSKLTDEELEESGSSDKAYAWTLSSPKIVVPFPVESQEGLFEVPADIEYIGSNGQFKAAYSEFSDSETAPDLNNLYNLIMETHVPEQSTDLNGMSSFHM